MRSNRSTSNDTMRRMDKKYGSRNEDGRRCDRPMHQKVDEEQGKHRPSGRKGIEERREGMGERRRNDNLEKPNLRTRRSKPTRRHHLSPSRREGRWTSWMLQDPGTDHQELLVAVHSV